MRSSQIEMFYCILCQHIQPDTNAHLIYKTGFITILSRIHHVGECKDCINPLEKEQVSFSIV
jgi:hypothetical protein